MPRLVPTCAAALVAWLILAPAVSAKPAYPPLCEVDPVVLGDAAGSHAFRVFLRNISGTPEPRVLVTLDFSQTAVRLYAAQEAGTTLDCAARTLSRMTDGDGIAIFHPRIGGACNDPSIRVAGDFMPVAIRPARSTDMDAVDGCTGIMDLGRLAPLLLNQSTSHPEADFDGSGGAVGLGDLAIFAHDLLSGATGTYCP